MAMTDPTAIAAVNNDDRSYVDWPAIFAGTALASAISLVLLTFGSAIGLSLTSPVSGSTMSATGFAIAAGLWLVWVQVLGFFAGGYLTGRMRRRHYDATEDESDVRDGAHGLTVWALGLLVGAVIAVSGVSAAVSTATSAASTVAAGAAAGAAGSVDEAVDANGLLVDRFLRGTTSPQADQTDPSAAIGRVLTSAVADGKLEQADKDYLAQVIAQRGVDPQQAQQRVEELWTQAQALEAEARATAERARKAAVIAAFATAASLLIAAAAAYFGAQLGGNHRDEKVVLEGWSRS